MTRSMALVRRPHISSFVGAQSTKQSPIFLFPGWFPNAFRFSSVHISKMQWDFIYYGAPQCEERRFPRLAYTYRFTCYRPIVGQYVTIRNVDDTDPENNYGDMYPLTIQEIKVLGNCTLLTPIKSSKHTLTPYAYNVALVV